MTADLPYLGTCEEVELAVSIRLTHKLPFVEAEAIQWVFCSGMTDVILPPCRIVCLARLVTFFSSRMQSQNLTLPSYDPEAKTK